MKHLNGDKIYFIYTHSISKTPIRAELKAPAIELFPMGVFELELAYTRSSQWVSLNWNEYMNDITEIRLGSELYGTERVYALLEKIKKSCAVIVNTI